MLLWDHPRTCGEKVAVILSVPEVTGSPPHMRGKVELCDFEQRVVGITPAHAGKRHLARTRAVGCRDHPRTCGEKYLIGTGLGDTQGSPPHMRGKETVKVVHVTTKRITPAHAGKSLAQSSAKQVSKDHPRMCGEKHLFPPDVSSGRGSPPHVRGKALA